MREQHSGPRVAPLLSLEEARAPQARHRLARAIGRPAGVHRRAHLGCVPLDELVPLIDWTPFFHAWELKGIYPRIFEDAVVGPRAKELFDDARKLLARNRREEVAHRARRGRILSGE